MPENPPKSIGVLVVANDLQDAVLNARIKNIIEETRLFCPKTGVLIDEAVSDVHAAAARLKAQGAEHVVVVPLMPAPVPDNLCQNIKNSVVTQGFDGHPLIAEILEEQQDEAEEKPAASLKELLPHAKLARFIEWRVAEKLHPARAYRQGDETKYIGFNEAQAIAMSAGASYPCSTLATRVLHLAFRLLWDDIPHSADMEITSRLPPEVGSRPVMEALAGRQHVTYTGYWYNVTSKSPAFVITNRANGRQLRIAAKASTYGGEAFFALRHRYVNRQGEPEDAARIQEYFQLILSNLLIKSDGELFEWDVGRG
jgi:hypothetical protein